MSKSRKIFSVVGISILAFALIFSLVFFALYLFARKNVNYAADDMLFINSESGGTRLFGIDAEGEAREIELLSKNGVKKLKYDLGEISDFLKNGFIAMEDREFYSHSGVNYRRTLGALSNYIFKTSGRFGASTITQQVVKNISGDNQPTITRKLTEIIRALHIEAGHSKEEILELYLNIVPLTDNMVGVGMGARTYFGKEPDELTLSEAATIIGITNSPARYNPYRHYDACIEKRNRVLYAMRDFGVIGESEYRAAIAEPINLVPKKESGSVSRSWFTETVLCDVVADMGKKYGISESAARLLVMNGGYEIYTTENIEAQRILEEYFENPDNFPSAVSDGLNYSMAVCDSNSGDLIAIYGSAGEKRGDRLLNYATVNVTPGSVLKPLALYAPLIDKRLISWSTIFDDTPIKIKKKDGSFSVYPKNHPDIYEGKIQLHTALEKSKNTVAVRLYEMLGGENIYYDLKENFGFDTLVRNVYNKNGDKLTDVDIAPLALGQLSYGIPLRSLTSAYTVFPGDGVYRNHRSYTEVLNSHGELILENPKSEKRVFRTEAARLMNKLLEGVCERGTARSITLKNTVDTAGKTGTSGADRDRLFIGYTPYITAGIWCGYTDKNIPVGNHSPSHLAVWDGVMQKIHEQILKNNESPIGFSDEGLEYLPYDTDTGEIIYDSASDIEGVEWGYFEVMREQKNERHFSFGIFDFSPARADEQRKRRYQ